ncbi:phage tail protein [Alkalilimnicola ehrlichii]|nr:phage tail protein [Alkalilimnicola ehrlichii]
MSQYYAILTEVGLAKLAQAEADGQKLQLVDFAVGDGGGDYVAPESSWTALTHEVWRGTLNRVYVSETDEQVFTIEGVVPREVGGWYIREFGALDSDGDLIVIAAVPERFKPAEGDGANLDQHIRVLVRYSNADAVSVNDTPDTILARKDYVDAADSQLMEAIAQHRDSAAPHSGHARISENLADLTSTEAARDNLGLKDAATRAVGKLVGELPAYEDNGDGGPVLDVPSLKVNGHSLVPERGIPGTVSEWTGDFLPDGALWCDGRTVSRTEYDRLFNIVGTKFGEGNGETTFNVPDRRNRVAVGAGDQYEVGDKGGNDQRDHSHPNNLSVSGHPLRLGQMPSHDHESARDLPWVNRDRGSGPRRSGRDDSTSFTSRTEQAVMSSSRGGSESHMHGLTGGIQNTTVDVRQPYEATNFIIWY